MSNYTYGEIERHSVVDMLESGGTLKLGKVRSDEERSDSKVLCHLLKHNEQPFAVASLLVPLFASLIADKGDGSGPRLRNRQGSPCGCHLGFHERPGGFRGWSR